MTERRPTLAELAAQSQGTDPWACPRCGCRRTKVETTYDTVGSKNRRRICGNCGKGLIRTREVEVPENHKLIVVPIEEIERDAA